ncbi:hypothetical protein LNP04_12970 [Chryseobacterium sp. C-71]|uniref:hypothetical protein n=1 Tax=Chryseobacterium sp. C-71 TaxID=2893882 RepID=UPI001E3E803A|nr:hypothetical protein [Chryseobacterium sp. C-71]UFH30887.1 hypothetical protein LNP04_12970 [Chryseobacterium sp. C-71]
MKKKLLLRLCLILVVALTAYSCRTDQFPEKETYNNSSKFQLTSKRISLNEAKHKDLLLPEIEKAESAFKSLSKNNVNGKVVDYGNGVSIDTDDVIYIENGANYHTYTFNIKRQNAPEDAPLENLLLSPLPDGTYQEFLVTYNLTAQEREKVRNGEPVNTKGKTTITELAKGTFNSGGQLAKMSCNWHEETVWQGCSHIVKGQSYHNASNIDDWPNCKADVKPSVYTIVTGGCITEQPEYIDPGNSGGGSSGGGGGPGGDGSNECTTVANNPGEVGIIDENGCHVGGATQPNDTRPKNPCTKIKEQRQDEEFSKRIDTLKTKITLKKETGYIQKFGGDYVYKDNAGATENANTLSLPHVETNTYIKGFIHTHVNDYEFLDAEGYGIGKKGIKMFSPADIAYFMDLVKNAQTKGQPLNDVYAVMVSSVGNYQIRFAGNEYQIKTFTDAQKEAHRKPFEDFMTRNGIKNATDLEFGMLKYMDEKMNLKNITLYRMNNDGTNSEIKLNETKNGLERNNCPS